VKIKGIRREAGTHFELCHNSCDSSCHVRLELPVLI